MRDPIRPGIFWRKLGRGLDRNPVGKNPPLANPPTLSVRDDRRLDEALRIQCRGKGFYPIGWELEGAPRCPRFRILAKQSPFCHLAYRGHCPEHDSAFRESSLL